MIVVRLLRVRRRWREFQATASAEIGPIVAELRRSRQLAADRRALSGPHRLLWRWYRHPLSQAYREARRLRRARLERTAR